MSAFNPRRSQVESEHWTDDPHVRYDVAEADYGFQVVRSNGSLHSRHATRDEAEAARRSLMIARELWIEAQEARSHA